MASLVFSLLKTSQNTQLFAFHSDHLSQVSGHVTSLHKSQALSANLPQPFVSPWVGRHGLYCHYGLVNAGLHTPQVLDVQQSQYPGRLTDVLVPNVQPKLVIFHH